MFSDHSATENRYFCRAKNNHTGTHMHTVQLSD